MSAVPNSKVVAGSGPGTGIGMILIDIIENRYAFELSGMEEWGILALCAFVVGYLLPETAVVAIKEAMTEAFSKGEQS